MKQVFEPAFDPGLEPIPLSLYVHFPWCVSKCPYCDFNSHGLRGDLPEQAYIDALIRDLDHELLSPETRPLQSLFLGGGTPSLFSGRAIGRLLEAIGARLNLTPGAEITLEANPGTVDAGHFRDYRLAGVNRLSIGVQSLNAAQLRRLGRAHDPEAAVAAVRLARSAGFERINLDLMFALPEQTPDEAALDLTRALALAPEHLSYYQLTLEPQTEFARNPPPLPDDDSAWTMQESALERLSAAGLQRYEVSAYARSDERSRHNLNYWQFGDYLGIGAGAHGKRSARGQITRSARHKHPRRYLETAGSAEALQEHRTLSAADLPFEFCMNALRLDDGFTFAGFETRTGLPASRLEAPLAQALRQGLVRLDPAGVTPTELGSRHLNTLLTLFLP